MNGISFYAVGSGTVVNNVAVINGADDGVNSSEEQFLFLTYI